MIDFDFHTHTYPQSTCASQSASELADKARSAGINVISVCNHDTIDGLSEIRAECEKRGLEFVNGVELTCNIQGESAEFDGTILHLIGYNIDDDVELFNSYLKPIRDFNKKRLLGVCAYLREIGYDVDDCTDSTLLREQLAEKGYFADVKSAKKYLYSDEIELRFPTKRLSHKKAIELVHRLHGVAVWAHPARIHMHEKFTVAELEDVIERFKACGLDGVEVFHPDNFKEDGYVQALLNIAASKNLMITLGSDSHYAQDKNGYFPASRELNGFDFDFDSIKHSLKSRR